MQLSPLYEIDTVRDLGLARIYRERPWGPHSPDLLRLLNRLRWEPMEARHVLVCLERHRRLLEDEVFTSRQEAEWAVFKRRWKRVTGRELPIA